MSNYPDPCQGCGRMTKDSCMYFRNCEQWLKRYRYRQKQINGFARKYLQPKENTLQKNPCESCSLNGFCDTICKARADWWDQKMIILRKVLCADEK